MYQEIDYDCQPWQKKTEHEKDYVHVLLIIFTLKRFKELKYF